MFRKVELTNASRHARKDKIPPIPRANLFKEWPFEGNPMRYASWVPEQVANEQRYQSLDIDVQGQFWRLVDELAKPGRYGRFDNPARLFEKVLKIPKERATDLLKQFLQSGLLIQSDDEMDYVQPELREQCLIYCAGDKPMEKHPDLWIEGEGCLD